MSAEPVPQLTFTDPWSVREPGDASTDSALTLVHSGGGSGMIRIERCVTGRLENAYPTSVRDVEIQVLGTSSPTLLTSLLEASVTAVRKADPDCRRIVFGARRADPGAVAAAEGAGFRYVVDVDLHTAELSLLVSEPEQVRAQDAADSIPGT